MSCLVTALNTMLVLMTLEYIEFWNKIQKIYQKSLAFMVYIFFDKRSSGTGIATLANQFAVNGNLNQNERPLVDAAMQQLAEELH